MRTTTALAALLLAGTAITAATAQTLSQRAETARQEKEAKERAAKAGPGAAACASASANDEEACLKAAAENAKKTNGGQKTIAAALNSGNAKVQANDFSGAITDYQAGVAAAPGHPNLFELHVALANAYRVRAAATYNGAVKPGMTALPADVLTSAKSDLNASLDEAGKAAAMTQTPLDTAKQTKVGNQMRESARLLASVDRAGLSTGAPRATLDTELVLFNQWAATADATPQKLVQYTPGMALPLLTKDKEAALKLADAMFEKQPTDIDTIIAYGQIVADAKLPPTDPRRVKAKTAVATAITTGTTNDQQKVKLRNARIKLDATT